MVAFLFLYLTRLPNDLECLQEPYAFMNFYPTEISTTRHLDILPHQTNYVLQQLKGKLQLLCSEFYQ